MAPCSTGIPRPQAAWSSRSPLLHSTQTLAVLTYRGASWRNNVARISAFGRFSRDQVLLETVGLFVGRNGEINVQCRRYRISSNHYKQQCRYTCVNSLFTPVEQSAKYAAVHQCPATALVSTFQLKNITDGRVDICQLHTQPSTSLLVLLR